ncbi:MAG: tetratricopeptide repeat protein, partial [Planctomycetota bacterium]
MGLRPKTARRLVLAGTFIGVVVVGGVALLTVPKWQRARQIDSFRRDGLRAHREGRHHEAVPMLNRHTKAVGEESTQPEVLLGLARSQAELEARRDGHINVAISRYRAYLRLAPDDLTARRELLGLLVRGQRWGEAVDLAERINPSVLVAGEADIGALRDEWAARVRFDADEDRVLELEGFLLEAEPPEFEDVWSIYRVRGSRRGGLAEAVPVLTEYSARWPEEPAAQLLALMDPGPESGGQAPGDTVFDRLRGVAGDLEVYLGLDGDPATPGSIVLPDVGLAEMLAGAFDGLARPDFAAEVLSQSLVGEDADERRNDLARRLYYLGSYDALAALDPSAGRLDANVDVLGYQMLAALDSGDSDRVNALQRELETVDYSYRAKSWLNVLASRRALDSGDLPAARAAANEAVERYETEPTLRWLLGNIHSRMGFPSEALAEWEFASIAAGSIAWADPVVRRVTTLLENNRRLDALTLVDEHLGQPRFASQLVMQQLGLRVKATLFRQGLLSDADARSAAVDGETLRARIPESVTGVIDLNEIDLALATMYGELGATDDAVRALARVLDSGVSSAVLAEARSIDERYRLGLAAARGSEPLPERIDDPMSAFRLALTYCERSIADARSEGGLAAGNVRQRVEESLEWLDRQAGLAGAESGAGWLVARARLLEAVRPDEAGDDWRVALDADPDNLDLLGEVVWTETLGLDAAFVDASIDRIRELTGSQGRNLPANLRLARARAIFGLAPARAERDEALGIARSVVASEPRNTRARLILGNMLAADCSPIYTAEEDRFEPDLDGAIAQFQSIAGQIQGREAVGYYFRIIELANRAGDQDRALRAVRDAMAVTDRDSGTLEALALALRASGDREAAARTLSVYFRETSGPAKVRAGLALVETYAMLGQDAEAVGVLDELAEGGVFDAGQLRTLAIRMTQNGLGDRVDALLLDAAEAGIAADELNAIRAGLIVRFEPLTEAVASLDDMLESDPNNIEVWRQLIRMLIDAGESDIAGARIDRGLAENPGDPTIEFLQAQVSGDIGSLASLTLSDPDTPESLRAALQAIEAFERDRASMSDAEQIAVLRSLTARFSRLAAVQNYTIVEREALGEDMSVLIDDAAAAARRFPDRIPLLRAATRSSLATGANDDALEFAAAWRGLVQGTRIEPDLYAAEAAQNLGLDARSIELVEPYLDAALKDPADALHTAALLIHGASSIRTGRAGEVRAVYEPLASEDRGFASRIWLPLAARWTPDATTALEWLDRAEAWGTTGIEHDLTEAWLDAGRRLEEGRVALLERALRAADHAIEQGRTGAEAFALRAAACRGLSLADPESETDWLGRAEAAFVEADRIDPEDLNFLFQAARAAEDDGRHRAAEAHYRVLLDRPACTGLFEAVVANNAAMSIVRQGVADSGRLQEAMALVETSIRTEPLPAFYGTRGWVRYLSGDLEEAAADFRRHTQASPDTALSWAGLALSQREDGVS